ncbi:hypothetical protein [Desulfoscipio geothermicus]|uniref:Uncharacterized protein n=1 Tax=Desulfoscipio geothermicus DSM 3669 TaxID=1121426 RepID=A0A1I6EIA2_9FIRM|nr:hypothetical protein [Desulfoscipio geothermicus]SFR17483.1 hypothetical protein SAMN05660706_14716 [Desulfoscipio geothermicus DSM 3669]
MEKMLIQLNKVSRLSGCIDIIRQKGLALVILDLETKQIIIIFNPCLIDTDTIMETFLQGGCHIDYFYNVA